LHILDRIEEAMIKIFLLLAAILVLCQYIIKHPRWAEALVLITRLEGVVYTYGGLN
jgi:predicted RND superfamily exporter protein